MERKGERLNVEGWLGDVKRTWEDIPEYRVDPRKLSHLAVICDGNRRSARARGFDAWQGHKVGVEVVGGIMRVSREWNVRHLTFWVWSTENWNRDKARVDFVMGLAGEYLEDEELKNELMRNNVRFTHLGRKDRLPGRMAEAIENLESRTRMNDRYRVNFALDYGVD